jgi:hypothetical protein
MGRAIHRLSAKTVEKAKHPGYHCDGGGLYLQVSPTVSKSWIFRYARQGEAHEMGLGSERDVTLAAARGKASDCRRLIVEGLDPIEVRDARKQRERMEKAGALTFEKCAEKYIDSHRAEWRNPKHAEQWKSTLETYAAPIIGQLAVKHVDTALVLRVRTDLDEKA